MRRKLLLVGGIAATVLVVVGIVLLVTGIDRLGDTRIGSTRTDVPGEREIRLEAEKYVIYYEVDGDFAPSGENTALADRVLNVEIRDGDGSSLAIEEYRADFNVESGGRYAQGLRTVEAPTAGNYRLTVEGEKGPEDPAVVLGRPVTGRLATLVAGIAVLLIGLGVALFVFIVALLGRRRTAQPPSR